MFKTETRNQEQSREVGCGPVCHRDGTGPEMRGRVMTEKGPVQWRAMERKAVAEE